MDKKFGLAGYVGGTHKTGTTPVAPPFKLARKPVVVPVALPAPVIFILEAA